MSLSFAQSQASFEDQEADKALGVIVEGNWYPGMQEVPDVEHVRYALYLTYKFLVKHPGSIDRTLIYNMKRKFNITSAVVNLCVKSLETIFDCLVVKSNQGAKKNCKRYSVNRNSVELISSWCSSYEKSNPDVKFLLNTLNVVR